MSDGDAVELLLNAVMRRLVILFEETLRTRLKPFDPDEYLASDLRASRWLRDD